MPLQTVRLGTPRLPNEGVRIGVVRRPPRGVAKTQWAAQNWFDVWFPTLAPSLDLVKVAHAAQAAPAEFKPKEWAKFAKLYRAQMAAYDASHTIKLLAALSHNTNFSIGCYCDEEAFCHRSLLRGLLVDQGAHLG